MKKGIIFILCLAGLWLGAATIQWYSDQPATSSPADSDIIALERPSPHAYKSATLAILRAYIGTNGTLVVSNLFVERGTNIYLTVQNAYFTNVYAPYITNFASVPTYPQVYRGSMVVSNSTANPIAFFVTGVPHRMIGSVTSNGIQVASGKMLEVDWSICNLWTNWAAAAQQ